ISRRSQGLEGVRFGDHRISSLIFADDVVLLAPSSLDLQHALGRFAAECEAAGMRVSTSKSEAMVLDLKKVACTLQVGWKLLPQVEEFKYLRVLFTSEGRMDREIDRRIGAAAAVMRSMYRSVVVKKELSWKAKLSIYQSIYVPTLTYGHELWVMTERIRSWIQAAEMSFLRRVAECSLRDRLHGKPDKQLCVILSPGPKQRVFLMNQSDKLLNVQNEIMDRLKRRLEFQQVDSVDMCDVIIAFVPIVSRAGTDIQAALRNIPKGLSHTRIILVSLHHTFDPCFIAPDSRHSVHRNDVFAVDCLYHEDQGLLNSLYNDKALERVIKHLGGETPSDKTRDSYATIAFNDHHQSSIPKRNTKADDNELIYWIISELIIIITCLFLPEGYSYIQFFFIENILMIIVAVIQNYYSLSKFFPPIIRFFVKVLGNTMNSHKTFLDRITISPRLCEVFSMKDSDVIFAFVPIVSRASTDIEAAVEKLPQSKPVVLVALHHTFNPDYVAPDSRACVNKERVFAVDCLFYEDQGLLNCLRNEDAIRAVKKHLTTDNSVENNGCNVCA
ncbi:hypothetical protein QTP70_015865, partial [Hemibagrus guttatus]